MTPNTDYAQALAMLDWQIELGADEAIGDIPINRYEAAVETRKEAAKKAPDARPVAATPLRPSHTELHAENTAEAVAAARRLATASGDLIALRSAIESYDYCALKKGARNLVFADGNPVARLMIIGEAPGRDEDMEGFPFVGRAGQLLDKMLAAIEMSRKGTEVDDAVYITNVLPWRPPQNRDPLPEEIEMMLPFLKRHIELVAPDIIVPMGNFACQALLGRKGITRLRGTWAEVYGLPALPMFHPAYLLRSPEKKREAWADLLELKAKLKRSKNV